MCTRSSEAQCIRFLSLYIELLCLNLLLKLIRTCILQVIVWRIWIWSTDSACFAYLPKDGPRLISDYSFFN
uniref:Uncharacterized protein n=1 Tax=Salix viminalis TaxID=40686 RepID=A0A6N2MLC7_SALVM